MVDDEVFQAFMHVDVVDSDITERIEKRCAAIEKALVEAGMDYTAKPSIKNDLQAYRNKLQGLISERRLARQRGQREDIKAVSKSIQREVRAVARARSAARIGKIMEEFKGLKFVAGIKNKNKKNIMTSMIDKEGNTCTDRVEIANVFAEFYEDLYRKRAKDGEGEKEDKEEKDDKGYCCIENLKKNQNSQGRDPRTQEP